MDVAQDGQCRRTRRVIFGTPSDREQTGQAIDDEQGRHGGREFPPDHRVVAIFFRLMGQGLDGGGYGQRNAVFWVVISLAATYIDAAT